MRRPEKWQGKYHTRLGILRYALMRYKVDPSKLPCLIQWKREFTMETILIELRRYVARYLQPLPLLTRPATWPSHSTRRFLSRRKVPHISARLLQLFETCDTDMTISLILNPRHGSRKSSARHGISPYRVLPVEQMTYSSTKDLGGGNRLAVDENDSGL